MRREEVLELFGWVWLVFSLIGGIYIGYLFGIIIAIAVVIQGAVFSVFLLVFSNIANTILNLDNRVKSLDESLKEIVKIVDQPTELDYTEKPEAKKGSENNTNEKMSFSNYIKNKESVSNEAIVSNITMSCLRSGPGDIYYLVGKVERGMKLDVLSRQNEWIEVKTEEGKIGWLKDLYIKKG